MKKAWEPLTYCTGCSHVTLDNKTVVADISSP